METKILLNIMKLSMVLVLVGFVKAKALNDETTDKFSSVDPNRIPTILTMISDQVRSNYNCIKTWEGKVDVVIDHIYTGTVAEKVFETETNSLGQTPQLVKNRREHVLEFSIDAEKGLLYTNNYFKKVPQYTDIASGRDLGAKGTPNTGKSIVTPEYYIKCKPDTTSKGIVIGHKAVKGTLEECKSCQLPSTFDPRESFEAGRPVWETLQHVLEQINKDGEWKVGEYDLEVGEHKVGDVIQYQIIIPGKITADNLIFNTMVFTGDKGLNIVLFQVTDINGRMLQSATWDYELVEGVYLPKKTNQQYFAREDGRLNYERKLTFKESRINQPISPETFTYKNLGLKDGDRFFDKIENKEYIFQNNELVEVVEEKTDN